MSSPRSSTADLRRRVPSVDEVLADPALRALEERRGRQALVRHVKEALEAARLLAAAATRLPR